MAISNQTLQFGFLFLNFPLSALDDNLTVRNEITFSYLYLIHCFFFLDRFKWLHSSSKSPSTSTRPITIQPLQPTIYITRAYYLKVNHHAIISVATELEDVCDGSLWSDGSLAGCPATTNARTNHPRVVTVVWWEPINPVTKYFTGRNHPKSLLLISCQRRLRWIQRGLGKRLVCQLWTR